MLLFYYINLVKLEMLGITYNWGWRKYLAVKSLQIRHWGENYLSLVMICRACGW